MLYALRGDCSSLVFRLCLWGGVVEHVPARACYGIVMSKWPECNYEYIPTTYIM